jgi:hypothetical protein
MDVTFGKATSGVGAGADCSGVGRRAVGDPVIPVAVADYHELAVADHHELAADRQPAKGAPRKPLAGFLVHGGCGH